MTLLAFFHIFLALLLIVLVLLQDSKGGAMGMFGGGGGGSVFGSSGGGDFLSKSTKIIAIFFSVTCVALAYMTSTSDKSVLDDYVAPPSQNMDIAPTTDSAPKNDEKPTEKKDK